MLRTKKADRIVCIATAVMLLAATCLWGLVEPVQGDGSHTVGYEDLLFDQSRVHTIEITMANWDDFIANATAEEYTECDIVVDGEKFSSVAIRAKGNTSLSSVATLGSQRYSFKVEFDHFVKGMTYHGLDKLSLNNMIQDATMMKDYLAYTLMARMDVPSSLCSYVQISVNGEAWGLYLAVEGVEDSFMDRNGMTKGELYKPDSLSFGGGRGNGRDFDMEQFRVTEDEEGTETSENAETQADAAAAQDEPADAGGSSGGFPGIPAGGTGGMPDISQGNASGFDFGSMPDFSGAAGFDGQSGMPEMPEGGFSGFDFGSMPQMPDFSGAADSEGQSGMPEMPGGGGGFSFGGFNFGMGSDDVKLVYTDDDPDSYSNIFNNAKTDVSTKDKNRLIESLKKLNEKEDLEEVVNQDEVISYLAVHNFLCNDDSYTGMMVHNYYLYEEKGQLSILPWDYNLGFGGFSASGDATSTVNNPIDSPVTSGTTDSRPLIAWIFSDEEALAAYHEAYDRFITENIESGWLAEEISRVKEMIAPYVEADPTAFYDMEAFEKAVDTLQTFCQKRGESVRSQLEGTIPSTTQGQQADKTALVDASDISTADMGSMNSAEGGGGGFGGGGGMPSGMPSGMSGNMPDFSGSGGFTMPGGFQQGSDQSGNGGFTMPGGFQQGSDQKGNGGFTMPGGFGGFGGSSGENTQTTAPEQGEGTEISAETAPSGQEETAAETAETENGAAAPADGQVSASENVPAAPGQTGDRPSPPEGFSGGFSGGGDFGGRQETGYRNNQWIWLAGCSVLLLAAILVIRKAGNHNN